MSKSALFIRHHAEPGKRDQVKRVWEKYAQTELRDFGRAGTRKPLANTAGIALQSTRSLRWMEP